MYTCLLTPLLRNQKLCMRKVSKGRVGPMEKEVNASYIPGEGHNLQGTRFVLDKRRKGKGNCQELGYHIVRVLLDNRGVCWGGGGRPQR